MSGERDELHDAADALIDETARSLMRSEPPAALRARVRSSIASGHRGRPWAWQPVLAGAAVVVIATVAMWRPPFTSEPVAPRSAPQRVARAPVAPLTEPPPPASRDAGLQRSVETVARRVPVAPRQAPSVVSREPVSPAAELLPPIEPIAFEPVESSAMAAIERMPAPMPVEIEQLRIERLFE